MALPVSNSTTRRLRRLVRHFQEGTVSERIVWEIEKWKTALKSPAQWLAEHRGRQWNRAREKGGYMDVKVEGRAWLRLHTDSTLGSLIYCYGFEENERTFLWHYLRPGDVFVDVGANIGLFSVIAAKRVGEGGRVYAFEPVALPRQRLEENIRLNQFHNVSIQPFALSDQAGWLEMSIPTDGHDAWSSLAAPIAGAGIQMDRIEAVTWDDFADRIGLAKPRMMKIDVEGWENRVLDGASATLSAPDAPLLQVEFTDAAAQSAGSSCAALYQHLMNLGYTVCRYDKARNQLVPDALRASYPYDNLYATKQPDSDNRRLGGVSS